MTNLVQTTHTLIQELPDEIHTLFYQTVAANSEVTEQTIDDFFEAAARLADNMADQVQIALLEVMDDWIQILESPERNQTPDPRTTQQRLIHYFTSRPNTNKRWITAGILAQLVDRKLWTVREQLNQGPFQSKTLNELRKSGQQTLTRGTEPSHTKAYRYDEGRLNKRTTKERIIKVFEDEPNAWWTIKALAKEFDRSPATISDILTIRDEAFTRQRIVDVKPPHKVRTATGQKTRIRAHVYQLAT